MSANTPTRRPPPASSTTPAGGLRKPAGQTTPGRGPSPTKNPSSPQVLSGVARSPSTRVATGSARPARPSNARRPGSVAGASAPTPEQLREEEAKAENVALVESLKEQLQAAENTSEDFQKQLAQTQQTVDELHQDHSKMEERLQEALEQNEQLEAEQREATKKLHESDTIYESEKAAMLKDREESAIREEELRTTVKLLKDKLAGRDKPGDEHEASRTGRPSTRDAPSQPDSPSFAPSAALQKPASPQRSDSKSTSRLVMQKDQLIESLRLELAEVQVKLLEAENQGGGRMAELEKTLLETRMTNARLMEETESYQLLLGEKTMNGEFAKHDMLQDHHTIGGSGLGSLAEELETAENNDVKVEQLSSRIKTLEDEKKALTLYVDKMLIKIMNHADQQAMLDQDDPPPRPPPKEMQPAQEQQSQGAAILGGISRSLSVFGKRQRPVSQITASSSSTDETQGRTRPSSQIISPASQAARSPPVHLTAHNDPMKAPSIPLGRSASVQQRRGHRRTQSSTSATSGGAGEHLTGGAGVGLAGPIIMQRQISGSRSPGNESGPNTPRSSFYAPSTTTRVPSSSGNTPATGSIAEETPKLPSSASHRLSSSGASFASHENGEARDAGASPPRNASGQTNYTGAVMTQNKLRPLRLVQQGKEEKDAEEAARKKANRASWMGWFKGGEGGTPPSTGVQGPGGVMSPTADLRKENVDFSQA